MKRFPEFLDQAGLIQLEFRAQIEAVLATGLKPTHLDWRSLHVDSRSDICDLMLRLVKEYILVLRVTGQAWIESEYDIYHLNPLSENARI